MNGPDLQLKKKKKKKRDLRDSGPYRLTDQVFVVMCNCCFIYFPFPGPFPLSMFEYEKIKINCCFI
jgi:hypothetical protein